MIPPPTRPPLEVADIVRTYGEAYRVWHPVPPEQAAVMRRLAACRTAALGGHVEACGRCGYRRIAYNSCRDRHCPKCQAVKRAEWLESRLARLLPVHYFHVVFTLPKALHLVVLRNQRLLYDLLFQAASQTLLTLAADPKRLGAQIGVTAILHTWGQNLGFHPHLHCVVTGGGLADGSRWIATRPNYFLPVKVLGKMFQGKFLDGLKEAYHAGRLCLPGSLAALAEPKALGRWLDPLYRRNWIVYAKRPFANAQRVFRYLGRYSHRVAIANSRLVSMEDGQVCFRWKDYADEHRVKLMCLSADEFLRRFLLHVLPPRFVRIRHYGLLAGRNVDTKLVRCRQLLGELAEPPPTWVPALKTSAEWVLQWTGQDPRCCPHCHGPLTRQPLGRMPAAPGPDAELLEPVREVDSS
jgi:hypothetical protein